MTDRLLHFGNGCHWELIETLATEFATMVLEESRPHRVTVEVKKFIIPQARHERKNGLNATAVVPRHGHRRSVSP